jgi:hypothetical protein
LAAVTIRAGSDADGESVLACVCSSFTGFADERVLDGEELIRQLGCNERGRDETIKAWLSAR